MLPLQGEQVQSLVQEVCMPCSQKEKKKTGKKIDGRTKKRDNKGPGAMPEPRLVPTLGRSSWRAGQVAGLTPLWVPSVTHHGAGMSLVYVAAA